MGAKAPLKGPLDRLTDMINPKGNTAPPPEGDDGGDGKVWVVAGGEGAIITVKWVGMLCVWVGGGG